MIFRENVIKAKLKRLDGEVIFKLSKKEVAFSIVSSLVLVITCIVLNLTKIELNIQTHIQKINNEDIFYLKVEEPALFLDKGDMFILNKNIQYEKSLNDLISVGSMKELKGLELKEPLNVVLSVSIYTLIKETML